MAGRDSNPRPSRPKDPRPSHRLDEPLQRGREQDREGIAGSNRTPKGFTKKEPTPSASLSPKRRSSIGPVGRTHLGHRPRRVWPTVSGGAYAGLSSPPSAPVRFPARRARTRSAKEMAGGHPPGEVSGPHTFRPGREVPLAFAPPDARDRPSNDLRRGQEEDDTTRVKPLRRARDGVLTSGSTLAYLCRNGRRSRPELDERGSND